MYINDQDVYQGVAILKIIKETQEKNNNFKLTFQLGTSKNSFLVSRIDKINKIVGIYVKYTKKPRSPWNFNFKLNHQEEIDILKEVCGEVLVLFVCHYDGIVCMNYDELKVVLDNNFEDEEGVSIKRKLSGNYWVKGRDGDLKKSITRNDYMKKIENYLS